MVTQCSLSYGKGRFVFILVSFYIKRYGFTQNCFIHQHILKVLCHWFCTTSCWDTHVIIKSFLVGDFQEQPPEVFYKKGVSKNFVKFTGKNLCQCSIFIEVAGFRFQVAKFLRASFLQNTSERLPQNFFRK